MKLEIVLVENYAHPIAKVGGRRSPTRPRSRSG
jgi:hypothetical protein